MQRYCVQRRTVNVPSSRPSLQKWFHALHVEISLERRVYRYIQNSRCVSGSYSDTLELL